MKSPKNLKDWGFVRTQQHDVSGIAPNTQDSYYYQLNNGVYYPAVSKHDWEKVQLNKTKQNYGTLH